ncbi:HNH endonuclease signature motif containing protein [Hydrogenophaga sp.]|uniref:HNH endonuclease n=1 Tax=Hydrogenophaga sp. TaxID=1904254 RepID=UPI003458216D
MGFKASDGSPNASKEASWSDEELQSTIAAYVEIQEAERVGAAVNKAQTYRLLSAKFERSPGAFERRMQNISAVLDAWNLPWIDGLKPMRNIGANVRPRIAKLLRRAYGELAKNTEAYEAEVLLHLESTPAVAPTGSVSPALTVRTVTTFVRDAAVKAWVLESSKGKCECCGEPAPFQTVDGYPYLEVHHLRTLASGGSDTPSNTLAICPNCHRRLHYGEDAGDLRRRLLQTLPRLIRE